MKLKVAMPLWLAWFALSTSTSFAGKKFVNFQTIPPGASVEINGSVTCTTPCSIEVPDYYFGAKHTVFSKHGIEPIVARFVKGGYVPKEVRVTTGPIAWTNLNGVHVYDYYLVSETNFNIQLDAERKFFPTPSANPVPPPADLRTASLASERHNPLSTEQVVQATMPAVVVVSTDSGWGSGFLISAEGVVVTNAHVIGDAQSVKVSVNNGTEFQTSAIYKDVDKDLALVKIDGKQLPFLLIANSTPQAGADVIAIGSPGIGGVALTNTVTKGIVSAVRQAGDDTWIQTDAAINHGNSGGPLLNARGEVVGVNTLAAKKSEYSGLNFAVSGEEISKLVETRFGVQLRQDSTTPQGATISINSIPSGADIEIDGIFVGSTPSEVPVQVGDRHLRLSKKGFKPYERTIRVYAGGKQSISTDLEAEPK